MKGMNGDRCKKRKHEQKGVNNIYRTNFPGTAKHFQPDIKGNTPEQEIDNSLVNKRSTQLHKELGLMWWHPDKLPAHCHIFE